MQPDLLRNYANDAVLEGGIRLDPRRRGAKQIAQLVELTAFLRAQRFGSLTCQITDPVVVAGGQ